MAEQKKQRLKKIAEPVDDPDMIEELELLQKMEMLEMMDDLTLGKAHKEPARKEKR